VAHRTDALSAPARASDEVLELDNRRCDIGQALAASQRPETCREGRAERGTAGCTQDLCRRRHQRKLVAFASIKLLGAGRSKRLRREGRRPRAVCRGKDSASKISRGGIFSGGGGREWRPNSTRPDPSLGVRPRTPHGRVAGGGGMCTSGRGRWSRPDGQVTAQKRKALAFRRSARRLSCSSAGGRSVQPPSRRKPPPPRAPTSDAWHAIGKWGHPDRFHNVHRNRCTAFTEGDKGGQERTCSRVVSRHTGRRC
jgi:hypothetical protein